MATPVTCCGAMPRVREQGLDEDSVLVGGLLAPAREPPGHEQARGRRRRRRWYSYCRPRSRAASRVLRHPGDLRPTRGAPAAHRRSRTSSAPSGEMSSAAPSRPLGVVTIVPSDTARPRQSARSAGEAGRAVARRTGRRARQRGRVSRAAGSWSRPVTRRSEVAAAARGSGNAVWLTLMPIPSSTWPAAPRCRTPRRAGSRRPWRPR